MVYVSAAPSVHCRLTALKEDSHPVTASQGHANPPPDVSVVIVHHETPAELLRCVERLAASRGKVARQVVVVDNASRSLDEPMLREVDPDIQVIRNVTNVGFAAAANVGLRMAQGRHVLLLNPDAFVEPETLRLMVDYMDSRPDVGCATPRLVREDGRLDLACRRSFPTPRRALFRLLLLSRLLPRSRRMAQYNLTYLDEMQETEIDAPCGAFMLVRAEVLNDVGLLDERYFMYGEDLDWAYRIKRAGWKVMYAPLTTVVHVKRASSRRYPIRMTKAFHDAMRIFYRQHYQACYPRWLSFLVYRAIDLREAAQLTWIRLRARLRRRRQMRVEGVTA
jgi:N-acetylglucosaminyl-diphospho-decaprenol L-rhamnosyltransferase